MYCDYVSYSRQSQGSDTEAAACSEKYEKETSVFKESMAASCQSSSCIDKAIAHTNSMSI